MRPNSTGLPDSTFLLDSEVVLSLDFYHYAKNNLPILYVYVYAQVYEDIYVCILRSRVNLQCCLRSHLSCSSCPPPPRFNFLIFNYVSLCGCVLVSVVPKGTRRGQQILWSWRSEQLWAAEQDCWELNSDPLKVVDVPNS